MIVLNIWQAENIPKTDDFAENCSKWEAWSSEGSGTHPIMLHLLHFDKSQQELTGLHASDSNQQKRQKHLHLAWTPVVCSLSCHHSSPLALMYTSQWLSMYGMTSDSRSNSTGKMSLTELSINRMSFKASPTPFSGILIFLGEENESLNGGNNWD